MCKRFENKVVLVAGAASGIGRAAAVQFAREGASLSICDVDMEEVTRTSHLVRAAGAECATMRVDVHEQDVIAVCAKATQTAFGALDVLVNFNGAGLPIPSAALEKDAFERELEAHVGGMLSFCKAALPAMQEKDYGKIVNVMLLPDEAAEPWREAAALDALRALTRQLVLDCSGSHIHVNAVASTLRSCLPDDVAAAIVFLGSDAGAAIHGEVLRADGRTAAAPA